MIKKSLIVFATLSMVGCSTFNKTKDTNTVSVNPVVTETSNKNNSVSDTAFQQKMTSSFKRNGLKIEWNCDYKQKECVNPEVTSIEVTGYATTNGITENNRDTAFKIATLRAKAKLRRFIHEEISTTTVVNVMSKNIEKANEKFKNNVVDDTEILASEEEVKSESDKNYTLRENNNHTVRKITEYIKSSSSGILKGIHVTDETVINNNNVSVTIRWDKNLENINNYLKFKFNN